VIVETVGVGQVEIEVATTCDTVVVVVNPGWGDSVQANKAGLLEIADILVINKADRPGAKEAARDLRLMLQLSGNPAWTPPILETVATNAEGIGELADAISAHRDFLGQQGRLASRRAERARTEAVRTATRRLDSALEAALRGPANAEVISALENRQIDPDEAANIFVASVASQLTGEAGQTSR
jgi:LAO/AO transport system kinase